MNILPAKYANMNGALVPAATAAVAISAPAFKYGYGVFETMLVQNGRIRLADYHWQRLEHGMRTLGLHHQQPFEAELYERQLLELIAANGIEGPCRARLQVYADVEGTTSYAIECVPVSPGLLGLNSAGLTVGVARGLAKAADNTANLKTSSALLYQLAARQATASGWDDALVLNTTGNVIESTIANIFWIKDGNICTPPLSEGCVAGVMRRYITETLPVSQQALSEEALMGADELFLTNAIRGVKWIGQYDGHSYSSSHIKKLCTELGHDFI